MLKDYGLDIQKLFLEIMLSDAVLFTRLQNIYNPENFDRSLKSAAKFIEEHADQYKTLPTIDQITATTGIKLSIPLDLNDGHYEWALTEFEAFTKKQELERAILKSAGNLYVADNIGQHIRKIDNAGIITSVAGNGLIGAYGDNGPATNAALNSPYQVRPDTLGNLYIVDNSNYKIRKVDPSGIITTIIGTGVIGYNGDGILATAAQLTGPSDIEIDDSINLYVCDLENDRIRKVNAITGLISTIVGNGTLGYNGENIPATTAKLWGAQSIAFDMCGNLLLSESGNYRVRSVTYDTSCGYHYHGLEIPKGKTNPEISISPNPVYGFLVVDNLSQQSVISIINITGQELFNQISTNSRAEIDMSAYPRGIYIIKIRDKEGGVMVRKIEKD